MRSFQDVLEKRVLKGGVDSSDFYSVKKAAVDVLKDIFGKNSERDIEIKEIKKTTLFISSQKSLWRSELILNRCLIIKEINKSLRRRVVEKISVTQ